MTGAGRRRARDNYDPKARWETRLFLPHNVPQPPAYSIPHDGSPEPFRRDEADAKSLFLLLDEDPQDEESTPIILPLEFYRREFFRSRQPLRL